MRKGRASPSWQYCTGDNRASRARSGSPPSPQPGSLPYQLRRRQQPSIRPPFSFLRGFLRDGRAWMKRPSLFRPFNGCGIIITGSQYHHTVLGTSSVEPHVCGKTSNESACASYSADALCAILLLADTAAAAIYGAVCPPRNLGCPRFLPAGAPTS